MLGGTGNCESAGSEAVAVAGSMARCLPVFPNERQTLESSNEYEMYLGCVSLLI